MGTKGGALDDLEEPEKKYAGADGRILVTDLLLLGNVQRMCTLSERRLFDQVVDVALLPAILRRPFLNMATQCPGERNEVRSGGPARCQALRHVLLHIRGRMAGYWLMQAALTTP
jgi:hypothetical protein